MVDALYVRVSSDRQTAQNQFQDLLQVAEREGSGRDWGEIRRLLDDCIRQEEMPAAGGGTRTVYRVRAEIAEELAGYFIYVEQGKSGKSGSRPRPMFDRMKCDAAARRFDRLLVWKVSRLGRDMRDVITTVYALSDMGITVVPVKSQTGPINSTMGKLLWAIQAWYAEFENDERSQTIKAGQARARAAGKRIGRPPVILRRDEVVRLRRDGLSWSQIASRLSTSTGSARRAYEAYSNISEPCQNSPTEVL